MEVGEEERQLAGDVHMRPVTGRASSINIRTDRWPSDPALCYLSRSAAGNETLGLDLRSPESVGAAAEADLSQRLHLWRGTADKISVIYSPLSQSA